MRLRCTINGEKRDLMVEADRRVVDLLRENLGLCGTKESCGAGECGSCTILVNGESRLSCLMIAIQLEGAEILTIEGISAGNLRKIQDAFVHQGAIQCGFCTPGMVLAAADLLSRNPSPDRDEIRQGLSGNLCRCTGYLKIVEAISSLAVRKEIVDE